MGLSEMKKIILRLMMLVILLGFGTLLFANILGLGHKLLYIQENNVLVKYGFAFLGILCSPLIFILWGMMLYDWGNRIFVDKLYKKLWFLAMVLGMFVGSWFYYVLVFEMGKTIKKNCLD